MTKHIYKNMSFSCILLTLALSSFNVLAGNSAEEIQQKLNAEVLNQPFSVADEATLNASLNAATERGKPSHPVNSYPITGYYSHYYYRPYFGYGVGYYYRPYHYSYTPYYWGYYW